MAEETDLCGRIIILVSPLLLFLPSSLTFDLIPWFDV